MNKYLVIKENSGNRYHIFYSEGDNKDCKATGQESLCKRVSLSEVNEEEPLVKCMAAPGTMAVLSRTEEEICPGCVSFM